jgi:hypothetical protein
MFSRRIEATSYLIIGCGSGDGRLAGTWRVARQRDEWLSGGRGTDVEAKVEAAITRAKKRAKAQLQADTDALKKDIDNMPA